MLGFCATVVRFPRWTPRSSSSRPRRTTDHASGTNPYYQSPRNRDEVESGCLASDLTYSIVLDAVGGDAGSLASRTVDPRSAGTSRSPTAPSRRYASSTACAGGCGPTRSATSNGAAAKAANGSSADGPISPAGIGWSAASGERRAPATSRARSVSDVTTGTPLPANASGWPGRQSPTVDRAEHCYPPRQTAGTPLGLWFAPHSAQGWTTSTGRSPCRSR